MYYAVKIGRNPGIYESWTDAEKQVTGYSGAKYKSFKTRIDAEKWIDAQIITNPNNPGKSVATNIMQHQQQMAQQNYDALKYDFSGLDLSQIIDIITQELPNNNKHHIMTQSIWTEYDDTYYIFTDGSYKKSTNKSGSGIYFGKIGVSIKLPDGFTNNQAELIGILYALQQVIVNINILAKQDRITVLISDSMYCINTVTNWMKTWAKNNWKKANGEAILNFELVKAIYALWQTIGKDLKGKVKFMHQRSHLTPPPFCSGLKDHGNATTSTSVMSKEYLLWQGNHIADQLAS